MPGRHPRWAALALTLLIAASPLAYAEDEEPDVDPAQVGAVLLQMLNTLDENDVDACKDAITRMTEIEPDRRMGLLHAYATVAGDSLHPFRREILDIVLDRIGTSAVRDLLRESTGPESTLADRTLALRLVREREFPDSMTLVLAAASNEEEGNLARPFVQRSVRESIAVVMERDPAGADVIKRRFHGLSAYVQDLVLDVFEKRVEGFGTLEMSRMLSSDARLNRSVLPRLVRLPIRRPRPLANGAQSSVAWSMQCEDAATRRFAAYVVGRFHMTELVDELLALLEDPDARVAAAAHRALVQVSGARLISRKELWETWLAGEREWGAERLAGVLESVQAGDVEIAQSALQQLPRHRLHREAMLPALQEACRHDSPIVRQLACESLGLLSAPAALDMLARRLDDSEQAVAVAASIAIQRITGLPAPEAPTDWMEQLRLEL